MKLTRDQQTILSDLRKDLLRKIEQATDDFISRCATAQLPHKAVCEAGTELLLQCAFSPAISMDMSQEVFAQSAYNCYSVVLAELRNLKELEAGANS